MSTKKHWGVLLMVCALAFLIVGCGDDGVDESKSVDDIKKEAQNMDTDDLRAKALKYKDAIETKMKEMAELKEKLPTNPAELLSEDTKELKSEIEDLNKAIKPLKEKLQVCIDQLKEKKGDVSGLEIKTD